MARNTKQSSEAVATAEVEAGGKRKPFEKDPTCYMYQWGELRKNRSGKAYWTKSPLKPGKLAIDMAKSLREENPEVKRVGDIIIGRVNDLHKKRMVIVFEHEFETTDQNDKKKKRLVRLTKWTASTRSGNSGRSQSPSFDEI